MFIYIIYESGTGVCWAFSAVAAVEGITKIAKGELLSLSEQQLLDCSRDFNQGCAGGIMSKAFEYIIKNQGITTEDNYPYQESQQTCSSTRPVAATISGYETLPRDDEKSLLKAVSKQPVSVAINGHEAAFKQYRGGIFDGDCGTQLTHAVTIVGYGMSEEGTKYWLLKNSWGQTWGENGLHENQERRGVTRRNVWLGPSCFLSTCMNIMLCCYNNLMHLWSHVFVRVISILEFMLLEVLNKKNVAGSMYYVAVILYINFRGNYLIL